MPLGESHERRHASRGCEATLGWDQRGGRKPPRQAPGLYSADLVLGRGNPESEGKGGHVAFHVHLLSVIGETSRASVLVPATTVK